MTLIVTAPFSVAGAPVSGSASGVGYIMAGRYAGGNVETYLVKTYNFATESTELLVNTLSADHRNGATIGGPDWALIGGSIDGSLVAEKVEYASATISNIQSLSFATYAVSSIGNSTYGIIPIENFNNQPADRYSYASETRTQTTNWTIENATAGTEASVSFPTYGLFVYNGNRWLGEYQFASEVIAGWSELWVVDLEAGVMITDGVDMWATSGANGTTAGTKTVRKTNVASKSSVAATELQQNTRYASGTECATYGIIMESGYNTTFFGTQKIDFATDATSIGTALPNPSYGPTSTSTTHNGLS